MVNNAQTEVPLRDLQRPDEPDKFVRYINILHPHYTEGFPLLLRLLAPDSDGTTLEYAILHDACGIVVGNRWDGYFTTNIDPTSTQIMTPYVEAGTYYFHVPGFSKSNPYPVVPSLQEWNFPHDKMPSRWSQLYNNDQRPTLQQTVASNLSTSVRVLYQSCRMTDYREGTTTAHICPVKHTTWASRNGMQIYTAGRRSTLAYMLDNDGNATLLRQDLHTLYDNNQFLFYPKGVDNKRLVIHLLAPIEDIGRRYHNRGLLPVTNIKGEYAFARFAITILEYVTDFFAEGSARYALMVDGNTKLMTAEECTIQSARNKGSRSPNKRSRSAAVTGEVLSMDSRGQQLQEWVLGMDHDAKRRKVTSSSSSVSSDSELSFYRADTGSSFELPEYEIKVIDWVNNVTTTSTCDEALLSKDCDILCNSDNTTGQHIPDTRQPQPVKPNLPALLPDLRHCLR